MLFILYRPKSKTSIFKDWKLAGSAKLAKADFLSFLVQIKIVI